MRESDYLTSNRSAFWQRENNSSHIGVLLQKSQPEMGRKGFGKRDSWANKKPGYGSKVQLEHVQREILNYLASAPRKLRENGLESAGEVILSLGNCLAWISSNFDPAGAPTPTGQEQPPTTIAELGLQLQECGRKLYKPKVATGTVNDRLDRIERLILQAQRPKRKSRKIPPTQLELIPLGRPDRDGVFEPKQEGRAA